MNRLTLEERKKANKIRCKLLYTIDRDIRETKKNNKKQLLINSMTLKEIEEKFLLFSNYKMKLSATFTKIANKYMVMKTVDNRLNQNFFYSDYLQDLNKGSQYIVKLQRKRASANNIIKIPLLVDTQEIQSPIPEIFTNKMNIGDKKLIKPEIFPNNKMNNNNKLYISNEIDKNKNKDKNNINDDDSINSLTFELIQKKANLFSPSLNNKNKNKKELKRRKNQLEAIRKLRQFCFKKLKNKRRCITKSSHQNIIYINNKFDEEDEKNNTSYSSKNNININNKIKNTKTNKSKCDKSKNNSKKNDTLNESKKKKNHIKKNKDKKKINDINSSGRKLFRNNSTKKSPFKIKRDAKERKSLMVTNNLISGKLDTDILRFKKKKKEKNEALANNNPINKKDEDIIDKYIINHPKIKKKRTGILRESFKEKHTNNNPKKNKYNNNVFFNNNNNNNNNNNDNDIITNINNSTKKISSENNFFNRKTKTRHNPYSSICLIKSIKKNKLRKSSECKLARQRRYSTPNKVEKKDKKEQVSDRSINEHNYKKMNSDLIKSWSKFDKKEKGHSFKKDKKTQKKNNEKIKLHNVMQKVDEEDY